MTNDDEVRLDMVDAIFAALSRASIAAAPDNWIRSGS